MLAQRDKALDDDLDMISTGVGRLKNIALDMKEEIQLQNVMIDEVDQKIDAATDHLIELNKKVKKAFDDAGGATRFIANGIILILVIAAIAYIYKLTKK